MHKHVMATMMKHCLMLSPLPCSPHRFHSNKWGLKIVENHLTKRAKAMTDKGVVEKTQGFIVLQLMQLTIVEATAEMSTRGMMCPEQHVCDLS